MKPPAFEYRRVFSAEEAVSFLAELGEDAKLLAGGQSLTPMMNFRLARPSALIDVNPVRGLDFIAGEGSGLRIGALTRHRTVERCTMSAVADGYAVLTAAAALIGHYPIRTRGTIGGSMAHADPTAEWCLLARLLDARIVVIGPEGERTITAADWFTGFLTTSIGETEMITEVAFDRPREHAALTEFAQRKGDFAIAAAAVTFDVVDGRCSAPAVVLGGVASVPLRDDGLDAVIEGREPTRSAFTEVGRAAAELIDPPTDLHGDADYRRHLIQTLVIRAFDEALTGAG